MGSFKNKMQAYGIRQILNYVEKDPEANAPKSIEMDKKSGRGWNV